MYDLSYEAKLNLRVMNVCALTPLQQEFVLKYVGDRRALVHKVTGELLDPSKSDNDMDQYELKQRDHPILTDIIVTAEIGKLSHCPSRN